MTIDPDIWPAYCALCDRGFNPNDAAHLCGPCTRKINEEGATDDY